MREAALPSACSLRGLSPSERVLEPPQAAGWRLGVGLLACWQLAVPFLFYCGRPCSRLLPETGPPAVLTLEVLGGASVCARTPIAWLVCASVTRTLATWEHIFTPPLLGVRLRADGGSSSCFFGVRLGSSLG